MTKWAALTGTLWLLSGCVTVHSISVSQIPVKAERTKLIKASASRPILFFIPFGTNYVEEARQELAAQCPHGEIEGLVSKGESVGYFIGVAIARINLQGYCVANRSKNAKET